MKRIFTFLIFTVFMFSDVTAQETIQFENSWWEWVQDAGMSDKSLHEIAPHFPNARFLSNTPENHQNYEDEIYKWMMLWGQEYEDLINHPLMAASNPYNNGSHVEVYSIPRFMMGLESREKPEFKSPNSVEEEVQQTLQLQAWYFIFHPSQFEKEFGFIPVFPEEIDPEQFRQSVLRKIEAAEKGFEDPDSQKK